MIVAVTEALVVLEFLMLSVLMFRVVPLAGATVRSARPFQLVLTIFRRYVVTFPAPSTSIPEIWAWMFVATSVESWSLSFGPIQRIISFPQFQAATTTVPTLPASRTFGE